MTFEEFPLSSIFHLIRGLIRRVLRCLLPRNRVVVSVASELVAPYHSLVVSSAIFHLSKETVTAYEDR